MAAPLVLLLLLAVPLTAFNATNSYYVRTDQLCDPEQICHNLSHYISHPDFYFTSNTTFIFLEGQHNLDSTDIIQVNNTHNLTLKGQGQWPVAGPEETVMQSTVIINCTKGRGGFIFNTGTSITIQGLTVTNCGNNLQQVFQFTNSQQLVFEKNSIQFMSGHGLRILNCGDVIIMNCSYYDSETSSNSGGGAVFVSYDQNHHELGNYTIDLRSSNITNCFGGSIQLKTFSNVPVRIVLSHLILSHNKIRSLSALFRGNGNVFLGILNCIFNNNAGGIMLESNTMANIIIKDTTFVENELAIVCYNQDTSVSLIDSAIMSTKTLSSQAVHTTGCSRVTATNTSVRIANQRVAGFIINKVKQIIIKNCLFQECYNLPSVLLIVMPQNKQDGLIITNSNFLNNTSGQSVITLYQGNGFIKDSTISDNNMTGITILESNVTFYGHNVIQNNRYTEGAGITLSLPGTIKVTGKLVMLNNSVENHGGAILVVPVSKLASLHIDASSFLQCSLNFNDNSSSIVFSGNRAGKGGADIYGAKLIGCVTERNQNPVLISHVGHPNETSWYFDTPLMNFLQFSSSDKLSSMSSDPIMVCFCNSINLPDCSIRRHHIQAYPGLEITMAIATVGYYGGTSPGAVQVNARHATLVRYYGQVETTRCFQLHILMQKPISTTALVDIKVKGGLQNLGLSLTVDILECPIGFVTIVQQCHCSIFLVINNVQCNVLAEQFKFQRSGNSWFAYINNTHQCITGTTNCPFDYCNRSNVSFDIMAPDRQCVGNRTGMLCGQCQSHLSIMLGSNRCGICSNWYLFLIPLFALIGIVLVVVLMFLNSSVSVGTINGLLFYANIVKLNEVFFFPKGSVPVVSQFIAWLNLDLGIEVCLFDGLDGYLYAWLQFAFPAYLFIIMGCILFSCRYSVKLNRFFGSHAVPATAMLFLMSYNKILLAATNVFQMSQLPCNDYVLNVWSVDGNIVYGRGKHLVLLIFSCTVLAFSLAYPGLVLCTPLLEKYSHRCAASQRLNFFAKFWKLFYVYTSPYKNKYCFWTGVTLIVRLIIALTVPFTSGRLAVVNATIIITVVVGILSFWYLTNGVYKNIYLSGFDLFFLLNLFFLSTAGLTAVSLNSTNYQGVTIASVCMTFGVSLLILLLHIGQKINIKRKLGFNKNEKGYAILQVVADEDDNNSSSSLSLNTHSSHQEEHHFEALNSFPSDEQQPVSSPASV